MYDPWSLVPGPWSLVPGPWSLVDGAWSIHLIIEIKMYYTKFSLKFSKTFACGELSQLITMLFQL